MMILRLGLLRQGIIMGFLLLRRKRMPMKFWRTGLDPELGFRITFRRIGAGLQNLGNTCFLNSVLQCLTYTEPLAAYLQSGKHQMSCHIAGFCALCAIQRHVSRALQSTGGIVVPKDLVSNLRCISRNFRNARQEDAHEYMIHLLESMHKCCLPSGVPTESPSAYEKSLVHKIFGGRLRSQVKCLQCSYCSNTFDPFLDLSLEIVKADSLSKALMHFTAKEQLDGGEKQYQCQRCKQKVRALKQLTVHKAPYVLTIHLKRFGSHIPGQKIDKKVHFGPTLDLKPFMDGDLMYTLYGVLVHAGWSTHSGHYYCFVRTSTGMWYSLDDNRVVQVSERTVLDQKAYMLFYVRDRTNVSAKKPANVADKGTVPAAVSNVSLATSEPGCKGIQNGYTERHVKLTLQNGVLSKHIGVNHASDVPVQKSVTSICASNKILLKEEPVVKCNGAISSENSALGKGKDSVSSSDAEGVAQSTKCTNNGSSSISVTAVPLIDAKTSTEGVNYALNSVSKPYNVSLPPSIVTDMTGKACRKIDAVTDKICNASISNNLNIFPEKVDHHVASNNGVNEDHDMASNGDKKESVKPSRNKKLIGSKSASPVNMNEHLSVIATSSISSKKLKKLKKIKVAGIGIGYKMLYKVSLRLCKRKKGKKKKLRNQNLALEDLLDEGPSTSDRMASSLPGSSLHSQAGFDSGARKGHNGALEKKMMKCNGNLTVENFDGQFKERMAQDNAVLGTDGKLLECSSSPSLPNQLGTKKPSSSNDALNPEAQSDMMIMLTRGLNDTNGSVAHWHGIELPSFHIMESNGSEGISIGYVPDEWDEDYDCGKRKKVKRSRNRFGGPNPFQEIATKKAKMNMGKRQW
ncbi:hypothetical protein Ancab_006715 [Ancistrocladus abbreviatus]